MSLRGTAGKVIGAAAPAVRVAGRAFAQVRYLAGRFLPVTLVLAGALCGVVAVFFHRYVELARELLVGRALEQQGWTRVALVLLTPAVTFALLAFLIRRFATWRRR